MKDPIQCNRSISITWYALASQLHYDGLNYLESLRLLRDHFGQWTPHFDGKGIPSTIDCKTFSDWREQNKITIASYRGTITTLSDDDLAHLEEMEQGLGGG
jgi:hypothetical protein